MADHIGNLAHLHARDTTLVYASRGSQSDIARIKARMGWDHPWYTIVPGPQGAFDVDFGVDEWHGTNAFIRDGDRVSARTSSTAAATRCSTTPSISWT